MAHLPASRTGVALREFLRSESVSGFVLLLSATMALVVPTSSLSPAYFDALSTYFAGLSVLHWINDGLMALFFLLVGLEIKREFTEGHLADWPSRRLPIIAATAGMIVP